MSNEEIKLPDNWRNDVMTVYALARKRNNTIPDETLDMMRDILLAAAPAPAQQDKQAGDAALREAKDALTTCVDFIADAHIIEAQWHWEPKQAAESAIKAIDAAMSAPQQADGAGGA